MSILEVQGLTKRYPSFLLDGVTFSMEQGRVMGLIGRNGAGKTTTLKSIFNLVHPDGGAVRIFGLEMPRDERAIKQRIGYAGGAVDFYSRKKLSQIVDVTKRFYDDWDDDACRKYLDAFSLDKNKTPRELSEGMRVKFSLTLALSHRAELLILDEPTSGLDPVSRAELLDAFLFLKKKGVSILFSTHITTDLEKCADDITYIARGKLIASEPLASFMGTNAKAGHGETLEEIMVHYEKESLYEKLADERV
ncbi:MAG: ABC transporter ATP-binding protein [Clostridia bacterium]|nr:ABC transporter ATP-binding protein [Clostridia bacterium]